jgi:NAD(P)-dependent dehydrogenase (short-subunit alcohol dehydrogenase family)
MSDFTDKVVMVTGAGKGAGRAVAEAFASHGALLAVNDVTPINLDETVKSIRDAGGQVRDYVEDVAKKIPIQTLLNQVLDDFGHIDVLVNCAEVEPVQALLDMDEWDWQRTLDVNLNGAFLLTQSLGRIMREKGGGVIVHVGERARGPEKRAAYFASKAGLAAFSALAAVELAEVGVHVYHVQPDEVRDLVAEVLALCA